MSGSAPNAKEIGAEAAAAPVVSLNLGFVHHGEASTLHLVDGRTVKRLLARPRTRRGAAIRESAGRNACELLMERKPSARDEHARLTRAQHVDRATARGLVDFPRAIILERCWSIDSRKQL